MYCTYAFPKFIILLQVAEERRVAIAVRAHPTIELLEDRLYVVTCGRAGFQVQFTMIFLTNHMCGIRYYIAHRCGIPGRVYLFISHCVYTIIFDSSKKKILSRNADGPARQEW